MNILIQIKFDSDNISVHSSGTLVRIGIEKCAHCLGLGVTCYVLHIIIEPTVIGLGIGHYQCEQAITNAMSKEISSQKTDL